MWNYIKLLNRYFQTLRHLKFIQLFFRLKYIFPKKNNSVVRENLLTRKYLNPTWLMSKKEASFDGIKFNFLNKQKKFTDMIWSSQSGDPLWDYNLHYFNFLNDTPQDINTKLVDSWINNTFYGKGIAYESYPTSLRIVNLVKWTTSTRNNNKKIYKSIYLQSRWLLNNLEWHLLANHLFANAKALVFSGYLFETEESKVWLREGKKIIGSQLKEQVLKDGAHFELSPMYHNIFIADLIDLFHLNRIFLDIHDDLFEKILIKTIQKMFIWSENLTHPDKEIAFFNDASLNIAPTLIELQSYFSTFLKLDTSNFQRVKFLSESGFVRINSDSWSAILDVGDIGPDYNPGHARAASLSFELSYNLDRLFVNSGTSVYGNSNLRAFQRGTSAHNTVEIDNINSSDVWHGFRVGRRARNLGTKIFKDKKEIKVVSSHNGYKRLFSGNIHQREWLFLKNEIVINDMLSGKIVNSICRIYLHPDISIIDQSLKDIKVQFNSGQKIQISIKENDFCIKDSYYYWAFGESKKNKCIEIKLKNNLSTVKVLTI